MMQDRGTFLDVKEDEDDPRSHLVLWTPGDTQDCATGLAREGG